MSSLVLVLSLIIHGCSPVADDGASVSGFVQASGPDLILNGREYRAIGVNVPHLHQIYLGTWLHIPQIYGTPERARGAAVEAIEEAAASGFGFIRFFAAPGYPIEADRLYVRDPDAYWKGMDDLFGLCRRSGIRLVPCLGVTGHHSRSGEPRQAILDPSSKTWNANRRYVEAFVRRYRNDPTVLLWELENELMLAADVDRTGDKLPGRGIDPAGAVVREVAEREDSLTWEMTQRIYREQTAYIQSIDTNHLVTSGDAGVRPEATSRRETFPNFRFRPDTWREHLANELAAQPEPLNVFSLHHYGPGNSEDRSRGDGLSSLDRARLTIRAVRAARVPLFVGELGQTEPSFRSDPEAAWARSYIDMAEEERVALIALWVWHFPWQDDLSITRQSHPKLIDRVSQFNRRYGDRPTGEGR